MSLTISGLPRLVGVTVIPGSTVGTYDVPGSFGDGCTLLSVRHVSADLVTNADITGNASIPAGTQGRIAVATTNSTGNFLVITYLRPAGA
jgi:hypothetical protein